MIQKILLFIIPPLVLGLIFFVDYLFKKKHLKLLEENLNLTKRINELERREYIAKMNLRSMNILTEQVDRLKKENNKNEQEQ